ncbi:MAG TPA: glycoside hydrolase family 16 protein [Flavitalea sp.]|nr:glycoside hydrolase family 16 protein [Flavitalea sp.]
MKRWLLACLLFSSCTCTRPLQKATQKLVWGDEFNHPGLPDSTKWNYDTGGNGWGNNELQYYTAGNARNARVENGTLIIEAYKEQMQNRNYTSSRLVTKGKGDWKYGRIEVRAKLPKGLGTWPAIWMLGSATPLKWPEDGEIDIMEHVGFDQGKIHASVHTQKYNHSIGTQKTAFMMLPDCSENFHVYGLNWTSEKIEVLIDGKVYFTFLNEHSGKEAWPFDQPLHLLLNIAVGGNWGGQKGVDENIWPQRMEVDYVRVYAE